MARNRLSLARVAGIIAWTTASITWVTTFIAMANVEMVGGDLSKSVPDPVIGLESVPTVTYTDVSAPLPTMPETGLVVLRYTPSVKPEPETVIRRVVRTLPASTAPVTSTTKSSGS